MTQDCMHMFVGEFHFKGHVVVCIITNTFTVSNNLIVVGFTDEYHKIYQW